MTATTQGEWRNQHTDFVYPFAHLLPEVTALEQVVMPLRIRRQPAARAAVRDTLAAVGRAGWRAEAAQTIPPVARTGPALVRPAPVAVFWAAGPSR